MASAAAATATGASTTMRVRLPHWHKAIHFTCPPQYGVQAPDFTLWTAALAASEVPISKGKKEVLKAKETIKKANTHEICVDTLVNLGLLLSDAIAELQRLGWLSASHSEVVIIKTSDIFNWTNSIPHSSPVLAGTCYDVYEVFDKTPCDLFRTVLQSDFYPCVPAAAGPFGSVVPIACATFSNNEFLNGVDFPGLSLEGMHSTKRFPTLPTLLDRTIASAPPLNCYCDLSIFPDPPAAMDQGVGIPLGKLCGPTFFDASSDLPQRVYDPDPATYSSAYVCFMLPANTDVRSLNFSIVYDSGAKNKLAHYSLIPRTSIINRVAWPDTNPTGVAGMPQLLQRSSSTALTPSGVCEVFQHRGGIACPLLAGLFQAHCFKMCGKAGYTEFDPDDPGADDDIVSALEVCAEMTPPEDDSFMRRLLEDCLAARYALGRMGSELLDDLKVAFEGAVREPLSPDANDTIRRGIDRLQDWMEASSSVP